MHLERQTLSQAISADVLARIRAGEFEPGDRLPAERSLMREYGVGRNAAREAVQALVTLGLVEVRPGLGATVLDGNGGQALDSEMISVLLSQAAVDDLHAFRRLLEVEIARTAATRATPRDLEAIASNIRAFESAHEQGRPVTDYDDAFHAAVAQASHNPVYASVLGSVSGLIANVRRLAMCVPWALRSAEVEHRLLYDALGAHDPGRAAEIMALHLDHAIEAVAEGREIAAAARAGSAP